MATVKAFEQGCQEFLEVMHSDGHHIYRDPTGFAYDITLCRANLLSNQNEAYQLKVCLPPHPPRSVISTPIYPLLLPLSGSSTEPVRPRCAVINPRAQRLQLYETHAVPKSFACFVKYSGPNRTETQVLAPVASSFETAYNAFKKFFALRTRKEWRMRLDVKAKTKDAKESENDGTAPFRYNPPGGDEPKGVLESEWGDVMAYLS